MGNLNKLKLIKKYEDKRYLMETRILIARHFRDFWIGKAFEEGYRQKEIANACGLSESRVKKIIGEMKKNGENK